MKKLIAISVVFALVAGAAFAQVSATLDTRMWISGNTQEKPDGANYGPGSPRIGGLIADAYLQASGQNEEGTLGGTVRVKANPEWNDKVNRPNDEPGVNDFHRAFIWWKPIPQLRILLGKEKDGLFSTGGTLTDWAFHRGAEGFTNYHDWDYWRAVFPGNWDTFGLAFSIYPIDGLELNLVVPTGVGIWPNDNDGRRLYVEDIVQYLRFMGSFEIPDIGKIFLSWIGPQMHDRNINPDRGHSGQFGASFLLTALSGVQIQAGASTWLAKKGDVSNKPIMAGLAAHYTGDGFGVKFRSAFEIGGLLPGRVASPGSWRFGNNDTVFAKGNAVQMNVMPWIDLDVLTFFFDIGLRMNMWDNKPNNAEEMSWYVNPYIRLPIAGGRFQAGLRLDSERVGDKDIINYSIPFGLVFSF